MESQWDKFFLRCQIVPLKTSVFGAVSIALPHAFARAARSRATPANALFMRVFRASELPALRRRERIHAPFSRFARERGGRRGRKVDRNMRKPANPHLARVCGLFPFLFYAVSAWRNYQYSCHRFFRAISLKPA